MEIKKLDSNETSDFRRLIEIFNEVFENPDEIPSDGHLNTLLSNRDFMVFVVKVNNTVVGGLTIYVLHRYYGTKPMAYIYDVGMAPDFQGKGLGKALITEVCDFCRKNGFEDAYVEAESDDIDAVNFYRKTKFSLEMNAIHFTYSFNTEGSPIS
jgi:aminoglycoside 3-N-acetyltransferase I